MNAYQRPKHSSTDGFLELNPLAAGLLASPIAVAAFKITMIAAAACVFLALRRYRFAQIGAWWACAVYTVLTLRWAAVNSILIT
ncbi:MAG: DUF5658 family protein [Thermoguttaceae bacterium]|nr:DUF5658 family protein [Thermoguttaceae bacterium]